MNSDNTIATDNSCHNCDKCCNFKKWWIILPVVIFFIIFWQWISSPMIVTVTGSGEVEVPASNATITFAVMSGSPTAQGAITSVTTNANSVKDFLKSGGISEGDISTSQVTAVPAALTTTGGTGFQASITMSAKTVHISNLSSLVSSLYSYNVVAVSQPVLSVDNENSLDDQAYESAMKDAGTKASSIALKNWKFIKKVVLVSSQSSGTTSTTTSTADTLTQADNQTAAQNGVFKITETVSVSYKMW